MAIEEANTLYSHAMAKFALAMPPATDDLAAWPTDNRAQLVVWAERLLALAAKMGRACGNVRDAGLGDLLAQTRCGVISSNLAFVERWRAAAEAGAGPSR